MREHVVLGGVVLSPMLVQLTEALLLTVLISFILLRLKFYKLVWNRPLVELALFLILLGMVVALTPGEMPLLAPNATQKNKAQ